MPLIDRLAFDGFGNLFGALEVPDSLLGGVVYTDTLTGAVNQPVSGIYGADQIALHPSGDFFVTSERTPAQSSARVFRVSPTYDAGNVPLSATATSVDTNLAINNPEGLVVLATDGLYGDAGDLLVGEDASSGRVLRLVPPSPEPVATNILVDATAGLQRPEGFAFGDFGGVRSAALYVAETTLDNVLEVAPDGSFSVLGNPASIGLTKPDNLEFGPDGFLYVTEDTPTGRIIRIAPDGVHSVLAEGFVSPQGLTFDPVTGDIYISERGTASIYRVRF